MDLNKFKIIHFIGIGGIGVSALAKMMLLKNKKVSGSDLNFSDIIANLKKSGAIICKGHRKGNLPPDADLVIYSSAVPKDNPERAEAKKNKILQLSYFEALGELSRNKFTVAVSGTNGKTTTTAMAGLILERAGLDPTVVAGSKMKNFGGNFLQGRSKYFVVEACEHQAHMLELNPKMIILTNIEEDHLDYYKDIKDIQATFQTYIDKLPPDGILILNADDPVSKKLKKPACRVITYSIKNKADVTAKNIKVKDSHQEFDVCLRKTANFQLLTFNFQLSLPGRFNVYNALAAIAGSLALGIRPEIFRDALADFQGTWRRFEKIGEKNGAVIISDYAHHPTSVKGTIKAAKEFYPNGRIVAIFQPHQHSRTKKLFKDFVKSFNGADVVILSEIFDVAGREEAEDRDVSSRNLVREIKKRHKNVFYAADLKETEKLLFNIIKPNDLVLIMGAGDVYKLAEKLG